MVSRQERADIFDGAENPQDDNQNNYPRFDLKSIFSAKDDTESATIGSGKPYIDCEWGKLLEQNRHVLPTREKGYIDCGWGRLLEENEPTRRKSSLEEKGYIDCGWGRLLEANRKLPNYYSQDNVMRGSVLLNRRPVDG